MRSINARFNRLYKEPRSSYLAFAGAVKNQRFTRDSIARNFMKLVDIGDYRKEEKNLIIDYLYRLSNLSEEHKKNEKSTKFTLGDVYFQEMKVKS